MSLQNIDVLQFPYERAYDTHRGMAPRVTQKVLRGGGGVVLSIAAIDDTCENAFSLIRNFKFGISYL